MQISFFETTHIGGRTNNQDFFAHKITEDWACFVVADGLGGHQKGELAAQTFCECLIEQADNYIHKQMLDPIQDMDALVQSAHQLMCDRILKEYGIIDCHTTFALLWIEEKNLITAHIGDSRIYRIDKNAILWRTPDHTMVQQLFDEGKISEEDFLTHPLQNKLMRTVNLYEPPLPDIFVHSPLEKEEILVLCTDGFWTHLHTKDWQTLAKAKDKAEMTQNFIDEIVKAHPMDGDNITVQLVALSK